MSNPTGSDTRRREQLRLAQRRTRQRRQFQMQHMTRENARLSHELQLTNDAMQQALALARDIFISIPVAITDPGLLERLAELETAHQTRLQRQEAAPIQMSAEYPCVPYAPNNFGVLIDDRERIPGSGSGSGSGDRQRTESMPPTDVTHTGSATPYSSSVEPLITTPDFDLSARNFGRVQHEDAFDEFEFQLAQLNQGYFASLGFPESTGAQAAQGELAQTRAMQQIEPTGRLDTSEWTQSPSELPEITETREDTGEATREDLREEGGSNSEEASGDETILLYMFSTGKDRYVCV